jgi:glutathione S-transferase
MLTVWGRRSSFNLQKVMWLVGELDLRIGTFPRAVTSVSRTRLSFCDNPHGRVPVIDDGGIIVWESQTILRYWRAERAALVRDPGERSLWLLVDWSQASLQPDFLNEVFWGFYRTPEAKRNPSAIASKVRACAQHFQLLDRILADRPFLCGDDLTLADIPVGTSLYRYFEIDIERPSVPNVEAWYRRLQERPAYREHVMVPFGELFGRLEY